MIRFIIVALSLLMVANIGTSTAAEVTNFKVLFADPSWDGQKIPPGQHCKKFGGNGSTPPLTVENIPKGANAIVVEFNDSSYRPLSYNGGHGKIGFWVNGASVATLRPVMGGTKVMPKGVFLVAKNRAGGGWYSQGYLPPCSGGKGNLYVAVVKAVSINKSTGKIVKIIATEKINLGRY